MSPAAEVRNKKIYIYIYTYEFVKEEIKTLYLKNMPTDFFSEWVWGKRAFRCASFLPEVCFSYER